jgi:hypothetical protein
MRGTDRRRRHGRFGRLGHSQATVVTECFAQAGAAVCGTQVPAMARAAQMVATACRTPVSSFPRGLAWDATPPDPTPPRRGSAGGGW